MEYPIPVSMDLNEGRFVELGCIACREDGDARLAMATPFTMYIVSLDCPHCGEQLAEFDQFMGTMRQWKRFTE